MKVKELLADEKKWTKNAYARNEKGYSVVAEDQSATCWCIYGALNKCYRRGKKWNEAFKAIEKAVFEAKGNYKVVAFNDSTETTHEDLMRVLERADV